MLMFTESFSEQATTSVLLVLQVSDGCADITQLSATCKSVPVNQHLHSPDEED